VRVPKIMPEYEKYAPEAELLRISGYPCTV